MNHPPGRRPRPNAPGRWFDTVDRVYLDATVFESQEALDVMRQQLLPDLALLHGQAPKVKVVIHEAIYLRWGRDPNSSTDAVQSSARAVIEILRANPYVEWVTLDSINGRNPVAQQIVAECLEHHLRLRQLVFTQDQSLAIQLVANSKSKADRDAKPVRVHCVVAGKHLDWVDYQVVRPVVRITGLPHLTRVVVDTCSLTHIPRDVRACESPAALGLDYFDAQLTHMASAGMRVVVLAEVVAELCKLRDDVSSDKAEVAARALQWLDRPDVKPLCDLVPRTASRGHADPIMAKYVVEAGPKFDLCVVTQDRDSAQRLVDNLPGPPRQAVVVRIDATGRSLLNWRHLLAHEQARDEQAQPLDGASHPAPAPASAPDRAPAPAPSPTPLPAPEPEPAPVPPAATEPAPTFAAKAAASDAPGAAPASNGGRATGNTTFTPPQPGAASSRHRASAVRVRVRTLAPLALGAILIALPMWWWTRATISARLIAEVAVASDSIELQVIVDDEPVPMSGGKVDLRSGTRFVIKVIPPSDGELELQSLNSNRPDQHSSLLRMQCRSGVALMTPVLRVEGEPGVDLLRIVHIPTQAGPIQQADLRVRHD